MCGIACSMGYMRSGTDCIDVNECLSGNGGCSLNAACTNTVGTRTCACNAGFSGDGLTCTDVNECLVSNGGCDVNAACANTMGSRSCTCNAGYSGNGLSCTDVNECAVNNGACSSNATCTNTPGSRTCTCNTGYSGNGLTCADVNECVVNNGGCDTNAACTNTPGGRTCLCNAGYSGDGLTCMDVNECVVNNGGCSTNATCANTPGNRTCTCNAGYSGNGLNCTDVNECAVNNGGCSVNAACTNTMGSRSCLCNNGFTGDGVTCSDINECAVNNGGCHMNATCTNTPGNRTCTCNTSYTGSGLSCVWNDTALSSLSVNPGTLLFAPGTLAYAVNVSATSSTTLTATVPNPAGVTVTINGAAYTSGSALNVPLAGPATPIVIVITAASGATRTYSVVMTRALSQQVYAKAPAPTPGELFGSAIALSADGNTMAVGAYYEDTGATNSGAVFVFTRSGATWTQQAQLKASNPGPGDSFGISVALSASGDTLAVGATYESSNAVGINGDQANDLALQSGAAYVFQRSGTAWSQQAYLKASNTGAFDYFGDSLDLSDDGNTLVVGAYGEDSNGTQSNNSQGESGAAYAFLRTGSTWAQQGYLKYPLAFAGQMMGNAVSLSGNGNTVAIGAYGFSFSRGRVMLFSRTGSSWSEFAGALSFDYDDDDRFGTSISLSNDGNTLAVGAPGEDSGATGINGSSTSNSSLGSGAAYIFVRSGSSFVQQAFIKASNTGAGDVFGTSVSVSRDGQFLAVSSYAEDSNSTGPNGSQTNNLSTDSGAVYLFHRVGTTWVQNTYLKASNTDASDGFGTRVCVSDDGNTIAVGALGENSGSGGINGNQQDESSGNSGAVYVFVP
jgi:hypothetical protein